MILQVNFMDIYLHGMRVEVFGAEWNWCGKSS